jgi:hypothetical protein
MLNVDHEIIALALQARENDPLEAARLLVTCALKVARDNGVSNMRMLTEAALIFKKDPSA